MNAPVNVLAAMNDAAHALRSRLYTRERKALLDSCAAVAELIDAVSAHAGIIAEVRRWSQDVTATRARVESALALCNVRVYGNAPVYGDAP